MKTPIFLFFYFLSINAAFSQRYDNHWVLGQETYPPLPIFGGTDIVFDGDSATVSKVDRDIDFEYTNASVCDKDGHLMFATNGLVIIGNDQQMIENGDSINPGQVHDQFAEYGYPCAQSAIILPSVLHDSLYHMYHMRIVYMGMGTCDRLQRTTVDMRLNGGKGKVTAKNEVIVEHDFAYGKISATRHGNGRDWWVVQPDRATNGYYKLLVVRDSVMDIQVQHIGPVYGAGGVSLGQSVFSPDGTKYARYDLINDLNIFSFDRCSGELSDPVHITITDAADTIINPGGLAFSPNSRFLYVSSWDRVYQFDTEAADIAASKVVVAVYDGFMLPFPTNFYLAQLAPDGKIYLSASAEVNMLHVINEPDSPGLACDLQQHGLVTPTYIFGGLPHYPNYRQGPLEGSACDSLMMTATSEPVKGSTGFLVYPNPARTEFTIQSPTESNGIVTVYDITQKKMLSTPLSGKFTTVAFTTTLRPGIYIVRVRMEDGTSFTDKLVVQ